MTYSEVSIIRDAVGKNNVAIIGIVDAKFNLWTHFEILMQKEKIKVMAIQS